MDLPEDQEIELVARRVDFLEALESGPLHKRDLIDSLEHSRSTVDRAVDELQAAGLVERVTEGWVTTQTGRLAARKYRSFLADEGAILTAQGLLEAVPNDCELPVELLSGAEVVPDGDANRLFEALAERLAAADRYRAMVPTVVDSRHVRLCHDRVLRDGLDVEFVTTAGVAERLGGEFPHIAEDLVEADGFRARTAEVPPFGLLLTDEGEAASLLFLTYEDGEVAGFLRTDADRAVEWAREVYADVAAGGRSAVDRLCDPSATSTVPRIGGGRVPPSLRSEGFVRVDEAYFDRRDPLDPATGWRVGLGLPEVAAGQAVERRPPSSVADGDGDPSSNDVDPPGISTSNEVDPTATSDSNGEAPPAGESGSTVEGAGDRSPPDRSLSDALLDRVRDGETVALVGPPGAGKSTALKRVACRYHAEDRGTVLYRESGAGRPFDSTGALEAVLDRQSRPTLVVVEDAVRGEANAVFEVMRAFEEADDVAFLLDARAGEWRDPGEFPADARLDAFRREAVETVRVPPIDDREAGRLVDSFESLTGESLGVSGPDLLSDVESSLSGDATAPGTAFLFFHRLARRAGPFGETVEGQSTLDEAVDRLRADLADAGESALDAGVLAHLLNAAGVGVVPGYLRAVATAGDDDGDYAAVRAAIDRMEGNVFFPRPEGGPYRGIHDAWSVRFLARCLDEEGEAAVRRRVRRGLSALLSLADDGDLRRELLAEGDGLDAVALDPGGWADRTVEAVFDAGRAWPKLAPLFGDGQSVAVELPSACSVTETDCLLWTARTFLAAGAYDRAQQAFEAPDDLDGDRRVDRLLGLSTVTFERGEYDAATGYARDCLDVAHEMGCEHGRARARAALGRIAEKCAEYDRAREHLEAALDRFESLGDRRRRADALVVLGRAAEAQSDYDGARAHHERSLELYRDAGDRHGVATAHNELGLVAQRRSEYDRAQRHYRRALEIHRTVGDRAGQAKSYNRLGIVAFRRGEYDAATEWYRRSLSVRRDLDDRQSEASTLMNLGGVALRQGNYDRARERLERAIEINDDLGNRRGTAAALTNLGIVAEGEGDYGEAREHHERSLEINRDIGNDKAVSAALSNLATAEFHLGQYDAARRRCEEARDIKRSIGNPDGEVCATITVGQVARGQGEYEASLSALRTALELTETVDSDPLRAEVLWELATTELLVGEDPVERVRESVALVEEVSDPQKTVAAHLVAARVAIRRGDEETAQERLDAASEAVDALSGPVAVRFPLVQGDLRRRQGRLDAAGDALQESLSRSEELALDPLVAQCRERLARLALDRDDSATARDHASAAVELAAGIDSPHREVEALCSYARAAAAGEPRATDGGVSGRIDRPATGSAPTDLSPVAAAERARSIAAEVGYAPGLARACLVVGRLAADRGEDETARRELRAAVELAADAGHRPLVRRSRQALAAFDSNGADR